MARRGRGRTDEDARADAELSVAAETKMKRVGRSVSRAFGGDMRSLAASLDAATNARGNASGSRGTSTKAKAKARLVAAETARAQAVLAHPTFRANPIAAISNHIITGIERERSSASADGSRAKSRAEPSGPKRERDKPKRRAGGGRAQLIELKRST